MDVTSYDLTKKFTSEGGPPTSRQSQLKLKTGKRGLENRIMCDMAGYIVGGTHVSFLQTDEFEQLYVDKQNILYVNSQTL